MDWLVVPVVSYLLENGKKTSILDNIIRFTIMYPGGYTAEVTSLSPRATEKDVHNFLSRCGLIEHVEVIRSGEYAITAYVTFRGAYALETTLLLNGSVIVDQRVCFSRWGAYIDECDNSCSYTSKPEGTTRSMDIHVERMVYTPGEAVSMAQEVVKTMVAKGYVLGKDALVKAKKLLTNLIMYHPGQQPRLQSSARK